MNAILVKVVISRTVLIKDVLIKELLYESVLLWETALPKGLLYNPFVYITQAQANATFEPTL